MFGLGNAKKIEYLEKQIEQLQFDNEKLNEKLKEKAELFNPKWRKKLIVSPYIFDKYIRNIGRPVIGGYRVPTGDNSYYTVEVDENMSDGYIRFEEAFEETHMKCKKCGETFKLVIGFPEDCPDFCSHHCYKEFLETR